MRGQLAHELALDAGERKQQAFAILRSRRQAGRHRQTPNGGGADVLQMPPALSQASSSLAGDYQRLSAEILQRISSHEQTTPLTGER